MSTMHSRKPKFNYTFPFAFAFILCFAFYTILLDPNRLICSTWRLKPSDLNISRSKYPDFYMNKYAVVEEANGDVTSRRPVPQSISTSSVIFPDWEVLLIASPDAKLSLNRSVSHDESYVCIFQNKATSPASFAGALPFSDRVMFKCHVPSSVRSYSPLLQPILTSKSPENEPFVSRPTTELMTWNFIAYESFSTEDDVVLFVKGVNNRQGANRSPDELRCVFGEESQNNTVKTAVTHSMQEVFRCAHPNITAVFSGGKIKISLEIANENNTNTTVVPSMTYYRQRRTLAKQEGKTKSLLCASTMVHNVAKFLKEWVMYHSKIGVDKFILYDNESDDDLESVIKELNQEGYNVEILSWIWPKTQEAGFSHSVEYGKQSCTWMLYADVDEFVYSPSWRNSPRPSDDMLKSLLPNSMSGIGQVSIKCNEFGPSNQRTHPTDGVSQGYTCRRRVDNRHKSIVQLEAVDQSLMNAIHHFEMKTNVSSRQLSLRDAVVNHYKYQAWTEFRNKFRRRVSTYVVDWTEEKNPSSNDRTPGLGFLPIEPKDWTRKFCEVRDDGLKLLTRKWFGSMTSTGLRMAWA